MKKSLIILLGLGFLLLTACSSVQTHTKGGELKKTLDGEIQDSDFIQTIGIGAADQQLDNKTQKQATSRTAAITMAQYEMVGIIKGLQIEGGITVSQAMEKDSSISALVNDSVKGAEVIKTEWTADDGCVVTLRLSKKRLAQMTRMKFK
ncbi:MAG: hypothetical protein PHD29_02905 [bacterium]|nr:hypothetical protein [bacterium]MDD5354425.1 hypothetical protein [bacterium]MDD5755941.1 hypothetical protein [bacterium]